MSTGNSQRWEDIRSAVAQLNAAIGEIEDQTPEDKEPDKALLLRITEAAQTIHSAAKSPASLGMEAISQLSLIAANRIFWEWKVFDAIPRDGSITYAELAAKVDADLSVISRPDRGTVILASS